MAKKMSKSKKNKNVNFPVDTSDPIQIQWWRTNTFPIDMTHNIKCQISVAMGIIHGRKD